MRNLVEIDGLFRLSGSAAFGQKRKRIALGGAHCMSNDLCYHEYIGIKLVLIAIFGVLDVRVVCHEWEERRDVTYDGRCRAKCTMLVF